jgi:hypothetical protein
MKKILITISLLLIVGCGTRKVIKTSIETKQTIVESVKDSLSMVSEKNETLIDTTSVIEEYIEPIDTSKQIEININGKIIKGKNIRFKSIKTKKGVTTSKKEESLLNQTKMAHRAINTDIQFDDKDIERKPSLFSYWWILIIIFGLLGWYEFKR